MDKMRELAPYTLIAFALVAWGAVGTTVDLSFGVSAVAAYVVFTCILIVGIVYTLRQKE
jgi:hypothetical protein